MTLELSIIADVFRNETQARHALEALRQAGFSYDQIGIAMHGHEGIDLQRDLENLGVSPVQASYYAQEVKAGHTVISVRPDGREREAHEIMRQSGALMDAGSAAAQTSDIDKQKAVWDQAVASHQASLAEQRASKTQEDFHQPRSLKPRVERVSVTAQHALGEDVVLTSEQKLSGAPLAVQEETTEKKPRAASGRQHEEVMEHKRGGTPVVQNSEAVQQQPENAPALENETTHEQHSLREEEHPEVTVSTADEEMLRGQSSHVQESGEVLAPQTPLEQPRNRTWVKNAVLLGGVGLGLGAGVLVVLLRGEQIRQFVLSMTRTMKARRPSPGRRNYHDNQ